LFAARDQLSMVKVFLLPIKVCLTASCKKAQSLEFMGSIH
jgi:hypothetical protein